MSVTRQEKALSVALRVVGVVMIVALWPLTLLWPSGWSWHSGGHSYYLPMILGLHATLGAFLLWASRAPLEHLSLIWFTVWSSVVHAGIMAVQAVAGGPETIGHLGGDVPALLVVAGVLGVLTTRALRARAL